MIISSELRTKAFSFVVGNSDGQDWIFQARLKFSSGTKTKGNSKTVPWIGDHPRKVLSKPPEVGNGPNTVSESTVSNTELSEFFGAHWVPGSELSEFLSAYYLCAKANSELTEFLAELTEFAAELSEFSPPKQYSRNSIPPVP